MLNKYWDQYIKSGNKKMYKECYKYSNYIGKMEVLIGNVYSKGCLTKI